MLIVLALEMLADRDKICFPQAATSMAVKTFAVIQMAIWSWRQNTSITISPHIRMSKFTAEINNTVVATHFKLQRLFRNGCQPPYPALGKTMNWKCWIIPLAKLGWKAGKGTYFVGEYSVMVPLKLIFLSSVKRVKVMRNIFFICPYLLHLQPPAVRVMASRQRASFCSIFHPLTVNAHISHSAYLYVFLQ